MEGSSSKTGTETSSGMSHKLEKVFLEMYKPFVVEIRAKTHRTCSVNTFEILCRYSNINAMEEFSSSSFH